MPKIIVCGSIGYGGMDLIKEWYSKLELVGYEVIKHVELDGMDYTEINDFRNLKDLSIEIAEHDLKYIRFADVLLVLTGKPSWGTAIEMYFAKQLGKKIILFSPDALPTPWPIAYSDLIVKDETTLFNVLQNTVVTGSSA